MTRLAAYLGPSAPVSTIVEQGTYSLAKLARSDADGWGIGWYPEDGQSEAVRLVSRAPLWTEPHHLELTRRFRSRCVLASVRSVAAGHIPEVSGAQPFGSGSYLFQHIGELAMFREVFERPLRERLSDRAHRALRGLTDSELLFATFMDALGDRSGADAMADALEQLVASVQKIAHANATPATFTVVVADGSSLVALRTATHGVPPTLHTIVAGREAPLAEGARALSSEPLFPGAWTSLDVHSLTIFADDSRL
jgi:predicted glutamine amidotransferase